MSDWIERVLGAEPGFERELVERYTRRLLGLARKELPSPLQGRVDPEDVVQSVYRSFFERLRQDRFSLEESHDLWGLLAAMTYHKARRAVRFHTQKRRDVGRERGSPGDPGPVDVPGPEHEPGPADLAIFYESLAGLVERVPEGHRRIIHLRLEGRSTAEIAAEIQRSERTVNRTLERLHELAVAELRGD